MSDADPPRYAALQLAQASVVYLHRSPVVVDCSVMAALIFDEPAAADAERLVAGKALCAPSLLAYEMANVARNKQRAGLSVDQVLAALAEFAEQPLQSITPKTDEVLMLALRYNLSAYDASYLWVAARLLAPLATLDRRLADAARQHLGVEE